VRHSGAATVRVRLRRDRAALTVQVADDGSGLAGDHVPGVGLGSMRLRAEELGGSLDVRSTPTGTTVTALLPLAVTGAPSTDDDAGAPDAGAPDDGGTPHPHTPPALLTAPPEPTEAAPTTGAAR
jgi:hypothetical protein